MSESAVTNSERARLAQLKANEERKTRKKALQALGTLVLRLDELGGFDAMREHLEPVKAWLTKGDSKHN